MRRLWLLLVALVLVGCATGQKAKPPVILATTTSTYDSGLLDALLPEFERETGYKVKVIAVGTGQALRMGREGNADVLLTHAPEAEKPLVEAGWVVDYQYVMYNDFVLVGPEDDPAGVRQAQDVVEAMQRIARAGAPFVSRGDDSGTHKRERSLWKAAGIDPRGQPWYMESGQGMGATLRIASEKGAYTLTDRGTYLALQDTLNLVILFEGDPRLRNVYHIMRVNPEKWPHVNVEGGRALVAFFLKPETQQRIAAFGVDRFGRPLFYPALEQVREVEPSPSP